MKRLIALFVLLTFLGGIAGTAYAAKTPEQIKKEQLLKKKQAEKKRKAAAKAAAKAAKKKKTERVVKTKGSAKPTGGSFAQSFASKNEGKEFTDPKTQKLSKKQKREAKKAALLAEKKRKAEEEKQRKLAVQNTINNNNTPRSNTTALNNHRDVNYNKKTGKVTYTNKKGKQVTVSKAEYDKRKMQSERDQYKNRLEQAEKNYTPQYRGDRYADNYKTIVVERHVDTSKYNTRYPSLLQTYLDLQVMNATQRTLAMSMMQQDPRYREFQLEMENRALKDQMFRQQMNRSRGYVNKYYGDEVMYDSYDTPDGYNSTSVRTTSNGYGGTKQTVTRTRTIRTSWGAGSWGLFILLAAGNIIGWTLVIRNREYIFAE